MTQPTAPGAVRGAIHTFRAACSEPQLPYSGQALPRGTQSWLLVPAVGRHTTAQRVCNAAAPVPSRKCRMQPPFTHTVHLRGGLERGACGCCRLHAWNLYTVGVPGSNSRPPGML